MDTMTMITMSLREISRLKTIQAVAQGNLRAVTAAAQLGLSRPQIDRLADRYRDDGPSGLVSKKRGLRHHQLPASGVDLALSIIRDRYPGFGPTLGCEKLRERHGISVDRETVRKLMTRISRATAAIASGNSSRSWQHCNQFAGRVKDMAIKRRYR